MKLLIYWDTNFASKAELFRKIATELKSHGLVTDIQQTIAALNHREQIGNTLLANNLAVPHVQESLVVKPVLIFVKNKQPLLDWQEGAEVNRFIFVLLPMDCPSADSNFIRQLFISLADDSLMATLAHGSIMNVKEILE